MRKILILLILFFTVATANAKTVQVESLSVVNQNSTSPYIKAKVCKETSLNDEYILKEGTIIEGEIIDVVEPKRAKRDAYIVVRPISFEENGNIQNVEDKNFIIKVFDYKKIDYKNAAVNAGLSVGSYFVKGIQYAYRFSEGIIKPDEGESRIKSGFTNVYENSPLSLIEKGKDVDIQEGDLLKFKFIRSKNYKDKDEE